MKTPRKLLMNSQGMEKTRKQKEYRHTKSWVLLYGREKNKKVRDGNKNWQECMNDKKGGWGKVVSIHCSSESQRKHNYRDGWANRSHFNIYQKEISFPPRFQMDMSALLTKNGSWLFWEEPTENSRLLQDIKVTILDWMVKL